MSPPTLDIIQPCWWFIKWTINFNTKPSLSPIPRLLHGRPLSWSCTLLLWTHIMASLWIPLDAETAVMHYGHFGGLSITCQRNELILMESELLGYSLDDDCDPKPLCSVPYTLAKWYCRGKSTCGGMQVERRPLHKRTCGSDFTNCLRVKYQCVGAKKMTDVCSDQIYETVDGYISSPSFPDMYPPDKNCTCSLQASPNEHVQVYSAFFLLKASTPCNDWVKLNVDSEETTKCGYIPEHKFYVGQEIKINFRSDEHDTEMGFWFKFSGTSRSPVTLRCGRYALTDKSASPKPVTLKVTPDKRPSKVKVEKGSTLSAISSTTHMITTTKEPTPRFKEEIFLDETTPGVTTTFRDSFEFVEETELEGRSWRTTPEPVSKSGVDKYSQYQDWNTVHPTTIFTEYEDQATPWSNEEGVVGERRYQEEEISLPEFIPEFQTNSDNADAELRTEVLRAVLKTYKPDAPLSAGGEKLYEAELGDYTEPRILSSTPKPDLAFIPELNVGDELTWVEINPDDKTSFSDESGEELTLKTTTQSDLNYPKEYGDKVREDVGGIDVSDGVVGDSDDEAHHSVNPIDSKDAKTASVMRHHVHTMKPDQGAVSTTVKPKPKVTVNPTLTPTQSSTRSASTSLFRFSAETTRPSELNTVTSTLYPTARLFPTAPVFEGPAQGLIISDEVFQLQDPEDSPFAVETQFYSPYEKKFKASPTETYHTLADNPEITEILQKLTTWGFKPLTPHPKIPLTNNLPPPTLKAKSFSPPTSPAPVYTTVFHTLPVSSSRAPPTLSTTLTTKPRSPTTPDHDIRHHVHSVIPWHINSYATGEFKAAVNKQHIALVDNDNIIQTTTTPVPTTTTRRSRTPEIVTLWGTLSEKGRIMGTVSKRKRPGKVYLRTTRPSVISEKERKYGLPPLDSKPHDLMRSLPNHPKRQPHRPKFKNTTISNPYSYGYRETVEQPTSYVRNPLWEVDKQWTPAVYVRTYESESPRLHPRVYETVTKPYKTSANLKNSTGKEGSKASMVWVLLVIAIIGWLIFMALLGIVLYYKRHRMPCLGQARPAPPGSRQSMARAMFLPSSLSAQNTPYIRHGGRNKSAGTQTGKGKRFRQVAAYSIQQDAQSRPSTSLESPYPPLSLTPHPTSPTPSVISRPLPQVPGYRGNSPDTPTIPPRHSSFIHSHYPNSGRTTPSTPGGASYRAETPVEYSQPFRVNRQAPPTPSLRSISQMSRRGLPEPPPTPGGRSLGIQAQIPQSISTQTAETNGSQTDVSLMSNPFESIGHALGRRSSQRRIATVAHRPSQPQRRSSLKQRTENPTYATIRTVDLNTSLNSLNNLNVSNVSNWALNRMPSMERNKFNITRPRPQPVAHVSRPRKHTSKHEKSPKHRQSRRRAPSPPISPEITQNAAAAAAAGGGEGMGAKSPPLPSLPPPHSPLSEVACEAPLPPPPPEAYPRGVQRPPVPYQQVSTPFNVDKNERKQTPSPRPEFMIMSPPMSQPSTSTPLPLSVDALSVRHITTPAAPRTPVINPYTITKHDPGDGKVDAGTSHQMAAAHNDMDKYYAEGATLPIRNVCEREAAPCPSDTSYDSDSKPALPPRNLLSMHPPPTPPPLPDGPISTLHRNLDTSPTNQEKVTSNLLDAIRNQPMRAEKEINNEESTEDAKARRPRDRSTERMRKLVPHQAYVFNDMVQPELRRILSKRRSKHEAVEV